MKNINLSRNSSRSNLNSDQNSSQTHILPQRSSAAATLNSTNSHSSNFPTYKDVLHLQQKVKQDFKINILNHINILVLGNSNAGKTSVINALEDCLPFQKIANSELKRSFESGKKSCLTERLLYEDKSGNCGVSNCHYPDRDSDEREYESTQSISHSSQFYHATPAISLWDAKGLERIADFDHASNVIKMILDGYIDDSQFSLCLMYRGVPEKSKTQNKSDLNRKKQIFNKKKRNFHAVILVCDATQEPPMRLLELFYDAMAKSNSNINKIPVLTVLTKMDVLEDELKLVEEVRILDCKMCSGPEENQEAADAEGDAADNEDSNDQLEPELEVEAENPVNLSVPSTPRFRKISETFDPEITNSIYLKKVEQVFDSEILLATASVSDHKNLDIFKKQTELKRFEKFFTHLSENAEKINCYKNLAALPILKQARTRNSSSNFGETASGPVKVVDPNSFTESILDDLADSPRGSKMDGKSTPKLQ